MRAVPLSPPTSSSSPASTGAPCGKAPRRSPSAWAAPAARSCTSRTRASAPPACPTPAGWPPAWPAGAARSAPASPRSPPTSGSAPPLMLPPFGPTWQRALNRRVFVPRVIQTARALGLERVQIWTFLPTDTALDVIDGFGAARESVVYNCGADFSQLTPDHGKLQAIEREVVQRSTAVFTNCELLARRFSPIHPRVRALPGGVSLEAFPLDPPGDPPPELRALPRPIIGYVGGLHRHLAMDLLVAMAKARPHWSWVYVGPHQTDVSRAGDHAQRAPARPAAPRPARPLHPPVRRLHHPLHPQRLHRHRRPHEAQRVPGDGQAGGVDRSAGAGGHAGGAGRRSGPRRPPKGRSWRPSRRRWSQAAPTASATRRRAVAAAADWDVRLAEMLVAIR